MAHSIAMGKTARGLVYAHLDEHLAWAEAIVSALESVLADSRSEAVAPARRLIRDITDRISGQSQYATPLADAAWMLWGLQDNIQGMHHHDLWGDPAIARAFHAIAGVRQAAADDIRAAGPQPWTRKPGAR